MMHQLDHMQIICTSLQTDNHASTSPVTTQFLQAGCPFCRPTNSVKALKAYKHSKPHEWDKIRTVQLCSVV